MRVCTASPNKSKIIFVIDYLHGLLLQFLESCYFHSFVNPGHLNQWKEELFRVGNANRECFSFFLYSVSIQNHRERAKHAAVNFGFETRQKNH